MSNKLTHNPRQFNEVIHIIDISASALSGNQGVFCAEHLAHEAVYETYYDNEKLSPLVREIPWTSNLLIMTGCKTDEAREESIEGQLRECR